MKRLLVLVCWLMASSAALVARAQAASPPTLLVFGDSISAGYGLEHPDAGWVGLLRAKLEAAGYGYSVINASVSGETTAGGQARLPRALQLHHPAVVIIELGGNDGLRALPLDQMRANLSSMVDLAHAAGAEVLLLGMRIPPNYGLEYTENFSNVFADVARSKRVASVPFLLADVALKPEFMQADGIHPNAQGQPKLLATVWPTLGPLLHR